jgi:hypothetical protein
MKMMDRPTWAYFADAMFRLAAPMSGREVDEVAAINLFLKCWKPKTLAGLSLPKDLASMVRTARKHGLRLDGIEMGKS